MSFPIVSRASPANVSIAIPVKFFPSPAALIALTTVLDGALPVASVIELITEFVKGASAPEAANA